MDVLDYVFPDSSVAQIIVGILFILFLVWIGILGRSWVNLLRWTRDVVRARDVSPLLSLETSTEKEDDEKILFKRVSKTWKLTKGSPVQTHLHALYRAGLEESRLDVSELLAHTSSRALREFGALRVGLGSFIIVGLLGTLFGLAESLAHLGPALRPEIGGAGIQEGLADLLGGLQSAFSPSIWGVLLTVVGVLLFGFYVWGPVTKFRSEIEHATLTSWVPALFPTTSQRLAALLERSEAQMHRNFDAAKRVADFAVYLEEELDTFREDLQGASTSLDALQKTTGDAEGAASDLAQAANQFTEAIVGITSYQENIQALIEGVEARSKKFENQVGTVLTGLSEGQSKQSQFLREELGPVLERQSSQLSEVLTALHQYEKAYLEERKEVGSTLQILLEDVRQAYETIGRTSDEFIERVGNPLHTELKTSLEAVRSQLQQDLGSIRQELGRLDVPLKTTAEQISRVVQTLDNRLQSLLRDVQQEFVKQNKDVDDRITAIGGLETQIAALLDNLNGSSERQGEAVDKLASQIGKLEQSMGPLSSALMRSPRTGSSPKSNVGNVEVVSNPKRKWWKFWRGNPS